MSVKVMLTEGEQRAQAWLAEAFPKVFGPEVRPIALGAGRAIRSDPRRPAGMSNSALRAAIRWRVRSTPYLKALKAGAFRYSLDGRAIERVTVEHAAQAITEIRERRERAAQRRAANARADRRPAP